MNYNLGYACINMALSYPEKGKERITTNRGMIKRTFQQKGLPYASALTLQNAKDLLQILQWNEQHGIKFYRMSSDLIPWASEYDLKDLPDLMLSKKHCMKQGSMLLNTICGSQHIPVTSTN